MNAAPKSIPSDFPWPPLPDVDGTPRWDGRAFQVGGRPFPFLKYNEVSSGWNKDLTQMLDDEGNKDHPITRASFGHAIASLSGLRDGGVVLEIGSSSADFVRAAAKALPQLSFIASDFIEKPFASVSQGSPDTPFLQFDLCKCPLPDGSVKGVVALNVLEHIEDDQEALKQIARILEPGGVAHIEVPAGANLYDWFDRHLMHFRRYSVRDIVAKARAANLQVERIVHVGWVVYPAFYLIKKRNRMFPPQEAEIHSRVASIARRTGVSPLVRSGFAVERLLHRVLRLPFGIRCVVALRKPTKAV